MSSKEDLNMQIERGIHNVLASSEKTQGDIDEDGMGHAAEMASIDAWLHRIGSGYAEYAPVAEPPKQAKRIDSDAFTAALVRQQAGCPTPEEMESSRAVQEAHRVKQLEKAKRKELEERPISKWCSNAGKMTDLEFLSAKRAMEEIRREKRKLEDVRGWGSIGRDTCGQLVITGECARCGITITPGIGSHSSGGGVLCGYCSDLNTSHEAQPTLRARFPKDISPHASGDGRIVRKAIT